MVKTFDLQDDQPQPAAARKPRNGNGQRRRGKPKNQLDGWIVLDKPIGITSTQALGAVKRLFLPEKAGHAGTLDPLASGLLPLAFGDATKTVPYVVDGAKRYRFTVTWGATTDTDDADGSVIASSDVRPGREAIEAALPAFVGEIMQIPPQYSAVKINGQRAYDLAREGEVVDIKARTVTITRLAIVGEPAADTCVLEADCGKGTYVRAIARDLAQALGTEGHVSQLRRTRVGPFDEADMVTLDDLREMAAADPQAAIDARLLSPALALDGLPAAEVDRVAASRLKRGQGAILRPLRDDLEGSEVRAMMAGELIALCRAEQSELHPVRVFRGGRRRITITPPAQAEAKAAAASAAAENDADASAAAEHEALAVSAAH
ncbi:tRNA pseudouridine(55) synthase TruB [Acuticoccus sp. MNP-M23]|uniref:tRNA pseudouridine(55) synthase TruB n=1 Tax=Acuticoccus sp. MNP-M23 TaxID=3072793 RepID=UPI00281562D8|nr:tRNA pseudouridine(55) synthase TruB [Acuticoccus sp. MNP-M23]WMS42958.1 tRNA pseudouridine(55) synthase TruB [Acuticoccus sp. MNP-M23]